MIKYITEKRLIENIDASDIFEYSAYFSAFKAKHEDIINLEFSI